jgi:hypothetical protein
MRGAVFVGAYSVPPARPTASHARNTFLLYIAARNYGLSVFIYVVSGNSTRTKNKKASPIPKMACRSTRLLGLEMPAIYLLTTKNTILAFTS